MQSRYRRQSDIFEGRDTAMFIAILEDNAGYRKTIREYIARYQSESAVEIQTTEYANGMDLLDDFRGQYDILLMDIGMQGLSGMETAKQIRSEDENVVIVFITKLEQYAIEGYSVDAFDFILKPITYYNFSVKLARAVRRAQNRSPGRIWLAIKGGARSLETRDIYFVEIDGHTLRYHIRQEVLEIRGTMKQAESELTDYHFVKCNQWCLVNLQHVKEIRENTIRILDKELKISRRMRNAFLSAFMDYAGGDN